LSSPIIWQIQQEAMTASAKILKLVERFDRNIDAYNQGKYKEAQVRKEFIDPFFKQLVEEGI